MLLQHELYLHFEIGTLATEAAATAAISSSNGELLLTTIVVGLF